MKRIFTSIVIIAVMLMTFTFPVFAASSAEVLELPNLKIIIDGKQVKCENTPLLVQGNTMLPLREMASILGVPNDDEHIVYSHKDKSVTILNGETKIVVYIGKLDAYVNDEPYELNVAPIIYGKGYTYVPFRFVAESLGKKVFWDGSANAVLICDADKFDNVKTIMTKYTEAMEKAQKYKMNMDITMDVYTETFSAKAKAETNIAMDTANKKMDMQMVMDVLGMQIKTQYYFADNTSYIQDPITQEWVKTVLLPSEYEEMLKQQGNYEIMQIDDDVVCAGLSQAESQDENEILIKGDVFLAGLFEKIMSQQNLGDQLDNEQQILVENCSVEIALDKNTYLLKSMVMTMKVVIPEAYGDDVSVTIEAKANATCSDYNGDFEIVIPDEVLESAVEAKETSRMF